MKAIRLSRRFLAGTAIALGLILTISVSAAWASPTGGGPVSTRVASCGSGTWEVVNSPGSYDSSPSRSHSNGAAVANGTCVSLDCYYYSTLTGPFSNPLWYQVGFDEWISDHYLNTPGTAAKPQPQARHCQGSGSSSGGRSVDYGMVFRAENSPGRWGNSPSFTMDLSSIKISNGDTMGLACYYYGNPTGPYKNTLWYLAEDISNNTFGWINDHYLNTPGTAAHPEPQTPICSGV